MSDAVKTPEDVQSGPLAPVPAPVSAPVDPEPPQKVEVKPRSLPVSVLARRAGLDKREKRGVLAGAMAYHKWGQSRSDLDNIFMTEEDFAQAIQTVLSLSMS